MQNGECRLRWRGSERALRTSPAVPRRWSYIVLRIVDYISKRCDNDAFRTYVLGTTLR